MKLHRLIHVTKAGSTRKGRIFVTHHQAKSAYMFKPTAKHIEVIKLDPFASRLLRDIRFELENAKADRVTNFGLDYGDEHTLDTLKMHGIIKVKKIVHHRPNSAMIYPATASIQLRKELFRHK